MAAHTDYRLVAEPAQGLDSSPERGRFASPVWRSIFVAAIAITLLVPFLNKPVHIDDANFLVLAEGAARDFWRPHLIRINWDGSTRPAFDVLSNPPGIAWWLAPVRNAPEWVMHVWIALWLPIAVWGSIRLARVLSCQHEVDASLFLLTCPVVVLSAHSLTPDLPLYALSAAGVGGFLTVRRFHPMWAVVAGSAALFRYSGVCLIPLLVLAGWHRGGTRMAMQGFASAIPIILLMVHDWHAYGAVHLWQMVGFQNDPAHRSAEDVAHNAVAFIAMLGGAGVLPFVLWRLDVLPGLLVGAWLGAVAAILADQNLVQAIPTVFCTMSGAAILSLIRFRNHSEQLLAAWALGGFVFLLTLRFAAARYWIPFIPGVSLLALRRQKSRPVILIAIGANVLISLGMAIDDQEFAKAYKDAAERVSQLGTGSFSGHWGWQHYLQRSGWRPLEDGQVPDHIHAVAATPQPQFFNERSCMSKTLEFSISDQWWGPRVYTIRNAASYHCNTVAGGMRTYAPWTFASDPYDSFSVYEQCDDTASDGPTGADPTADQMP